MKIPIYSKTQEPRPTSNVCRFPHVYTMFREGGTHPQEHRREDAMVVVSGDVGRYARNLMRAMLRCALRAVTLVAQKERRRRAPCTLFRVRDGRVQSCANWSNFSGLWQAGGKGFGTVPVKVFARLTDTVTDGDAGTTLARVVAVLARRTAGPRRGSCLTD